jgi:protein TonB
MRFEFGMPRSGYQPDGRDRAKAAVAALVIHVLLGAMLLTGLALHPRMRPEDSFKTYDVALPPPPPPVEEKSKEQARERPAPAGKKAVPSPIVAPPARIPTPQPVQAAPIAGQGTAANAGASTSGAGTGAGGSGTGTGGGGSGSGAGRVGARYVSGGLSRSDYRRIASLGAPRGDAEMMLLINPSGRVERCRPIRSSGSPGTDDLICQIMLSRARFSPAREADGTPLFQDIRYVPQWHR